MNARLHTKCTGGHTAWLPGEINLTWCGVTRGEGIIAGSVGRGGRGTMPGGKPAVSDHTHACSVYVCCVCVYM